MTASSNPAVHWAPRILAILLALFLSIFAFDAFGEGGGIWHTLAAFAIHLVPAALVVLALIVAWRCELPGGVAFFVLAGLYIYLAVTSSQHWTVHLAITLPLALIGAMFIASHILTKSASRAPLH